MLPVKKNLGLNIMRFTRDWAGNRFPVHCCLLDRECWRDYHEYHMPLRLHLHFLERANGHPVFITLWGGRRSERYFAELFGDEVLKTRLK